MDLIFAQDVVGTSVRYNDYLGIERYGKIGWVEPYIDRLDENGNAIVWVYIIDEDPQYNTHEMVVADPGQTPMSFMYAEMRLSNEVIIDKGE